MKIYKKIILTLASLGMLVCIPTAQAFSSPISRTNNATTTATFSVSGVVELAQYQWVHNSTNLVDSPRVIGSSNNLLTLSNVFGADAGPYFVIVSNSSGVVTSDVATLTVIDPLIGTRPANQTGKIGQSATFSVTALGTSPLNYQWRKEGTPLADATASTLLLTNLQGSNAGNYDVVITNNYGSVTSGVALLTVNIAFADALNVDVDDDVYGIALQPDGKILLSGYFDSLGGVPGACLGRLNPDGTVDLSFNPSPSRSAGTNIGYRYVWSVLMQPDSNILVQGEWDRSAGQSNSAWLWRLDSSGNPDTNFSVFTRGQISSTALAPDGSIWIGGGFTTAEAPFSTNVARLHPDGTVDTNFSVSLNTSRIYTLALQPDGKLLVGGTPMVINGLNVNCLARLNADGTVDTNFAPNIGGTVSALLVQPDGKILVGGRFVLGGTKLLARLNSNGSLDTNFSGTNVSLFASGPFLGQAYLSGFALQTDGRILCHGNFTGVGSVTRSYLARMNPDGSLDPTFDPEPNMLVNALLIQPDGALLVGGGYGGSPFTNLSGASRFNFGRLVATSPATQNLIFDNSLVTWQRDGSSPEIWSATFESSTNGADWNILGNGTRTTNGWQLTGVSIPTNTLVRARGFVAGGFFSGSSSLLETVASPFTQPLIVAGGSSFGLRDGAFGFDVLGTNGQVIVVEATSDFHSWTPLSTNTVGTSPLNFPDPAATNFSNRFYRVRGR